MKYVTRATAVCLAFLALFVAGLRAGGASAQTDTQLTIDQATHQVTAPAVFSPVETVVLWYNLPDGTAAFVVQATALDNGGLDFTIDQGTWDSIPDDASTMVAHGNSSGVEAIYTFAHPGPGTLRLDTTTMTASADANFTPYEPIVIWYNLPDGSAAYLTRIDALADGSLAWAIDPDTWASIPGDATSLVAHGNVSGSEAVHIFVR